MPLDFDEDIVAAENVDKKLRTICRPPRSAECSHGAIPTCGPIQT